MNQDIKSRTPDLCFCDRAYTRHFQHADGFYDTSKFLIMYHMYENTILRTEAGFEI